MLLLRWIALYPQGIVYKSVCHSITVHFFGLHCTRMTYRVYSLCTTQLPCIFPFFQTLVQQLEGRDNRLEQELADERQEHRENLTAGESREEGLVEQLSASEKQLSERGRILEQLSAERTSLTDKVQSVSFIGY